MTKETVQALVCIRLSMMANVLMAACLYAAINNKYAWAFSFLALSFIADYKACSNENEF